MCDNNDNKLNKLIAKESVTACQPCNNDVVGCQAANIRQVMANNLSVLQCYKNIKCAMLAYINAVSSEFVHNLDQNVEPLERNRFNVLIESLISGIHQATKSYTNGSIDPYFQLWIQTDDPANPGNDLYNIGGGSVEPDLYDAYCVGPDGATALDGVCINGGVYTGQDQANCVGTWTAFTDQASCEGQGSCLNADGTVDLTATSSGACNGANQTWVKNMYYGQGGSGYCDTSLYRNREGCTANKNILDQNNQWNAFETGN